MFAEFSVRFLEEKSLIGDTLELCFGISGDTASIWMTGWRCLVRNLPVDWLSIASIWQRSREQCLGKSPTIKVFCELLGIKFFE